MYITSGNCVACGACVSVCPLGSIVLKTNAEGFYMPQVDGETCIQCGKCIGVCPANSRPEGQRWENGVYYALWAKNREQRKESSSGGMFTLLAEQILTNGGVVFAAAYTPDHRHVRQIGTDKVTLSQLKRSKYVESYTGSVFSEVKAALSGGRNVLYCGTACQIDGLRSYLGQDYENLLTCDFLCHGVPASGLFEKYIGALEAKYGPVTQVDFRSKVYGWKAYYAKVTFQSGRVYLKNKFQDPFLRAFFDNISLREACYGCTRLQSSNADLTLGDFWGVTQAADIPDTNEGISLVGVHTERGRQALDALLAQQLCFARQLKTEQYAYAYHNHVQKPADRKSQLQALMKEGALFSQRVSPAVSLKGHIYHARALLQKARMKR